MSRLRRSLPPLATLLPFEAAARLESFTRAAAELSLTQAAISRQIRALETDLGTALFLRHHRCVALTPAGTELAVAMRGGLETIAAAVERLRRHGDTNDIVLRAELYVAMYWLIPRLPAFHAAHPALRLRVNASTQPLTQAEDHFDLALQCSTRPSGTRRPLFSVPDAVFPVCSPALAEAHGLALADLHRYPILHCRNDDHDGWLGWTDWFSAIAEQTGARVESGAGPTSGPSFDNYPVMLQSVLMGQGIGLGWARGLEQLLGSGQLVRPVAESLTLPRGLSVFAADPDGDDVRRRIVCDWLRGELA
ncbi:LysR family transcriptional regulator [Salinisphaera sp. Q1T1-3]|uniref:LysR family transcriptional regulator n=1 Tax=Salinisphaera sp. Q1T1-3 TaxID=2321229 RepID=UPI000E74905B|nr:LysR family transcriptional regulator [Salinisphaera sp. Q1T1-3]RJS91611.1 LysR family transcriptional regulator [Salinisphaera sp. Q1T1-3]